MKIPRILIAAPKSGSGKTMLTCGLMQCLKNEDRKVQAFKCGPDYIDPMFHETVLGIPSENLDTYFSEEDNLGHFVTKVCEENETNLAVIEGVMGLYDGIGGGNIEGSAYHVATCLDAPIILVVDTYGMADSILALLAGFLSFDEHHLIRGVILNRMSLDYYKIMKPIIEERLNLPVVGYCPVLEEGKVESRHLGLKMPHEIENIQSNMKRIAAVLQESLDIERIVAIASKASELPECDEVNRPEATLSLGVAMDEAFCFYYRENLRRFEEQGVRIVPFSPIHDSKLPNGISGILLGGGYPENYMKELSQNETMKQSILNAIQQGMPSLAECGGFMYLHDTMIDDTGNEYRMVGAVNGCVTNQKRLVRFGYIEITGNESNGLITCVDAIRGHEFHFYDSSNNGSSCIATKPRTQIDWKCIHSDDHTCWGFPHLYYGSNPQFVSRFVDVMKLYQKRER